MKTSKETSSCPICGINIVNEFKFSNEKMKPVLLQCFDCELIYKDPASDKQGLAIEKGEYYSSKKIGSIVDKRFLNHFNRRAKDHFNSLSKFLDDKKNRNVLDIGSGAGIFLKYLHERGWNVEGIEPDPVMHSYATNELGLNVYRGKFEEWNTEKIFDLVYLSHVLDDLPNVNLNLKKINSLMQPGSLIFLEVPNHSWTNRINSEKSEDLVVGHYFFSMKSLKKLVEQNNFEVLYLDTFHLVHLNTVYQKIISPIMFLFKFRPKKYKPNLRLIAKKV
tara:strand:+ start:2955 stop:3785 length:831 start_codon:yes stop_codon:yes gene_type:complete